MSESTLARQPLCPECMGRWLAFPSGAHTQRSPPAESRAPNSQVSWKGMEREQGKPVSVSAPTVVSSQAFSLTLTRERLPPPLLKEGQVIFTKCPEPWGPRGPLCLRSLTENQSAVSLLAEYYGSPPGRSLNQMISKIPPKANTL